MQQIYAENLKPDMHQSSRVSEEPGTNLENMFQLERTAVTM